MGRTYSHIEPYRFTGSMICCDPDAESLATQLLTGIVRTFGGNGAEAFVTDRNPCFSDES